MIKNKVQYKEYLEADKIALKMAKKRPSFMRDDIWRFQRLLRRVEYVNNCRRSFLGKWYLLYLKFRFKIMSKNLGFTIPINTFGKGLSIAHRGTIIINGKAKIGENCRIHACVNIGGWNGYPIIGNNVYIGPGAKIFGNIKIADGIKIGANAVVNKSFYEPNSIIVGVPAKKVK